MIENPDTLRTYAAIFEKPYRDGRGVVHPAGEACKAAARALRFLADALEPSEAVIDAGLAVTAAWHNLEGSALTVNRQKMRMRFSGMVRALLVR